MKINNGTSNKLDFGKYFVVSSIVQIQIRICILVLVMSIVIGIRYFSSVYKDSNWYDIILVFSVLLPFAVNDVAIAIE